MITDNKAVSKQNICPVCNATDIVVFLELLQVPLHCNLLWLTQEEAIQTPRGDIQLGFCQGCGHIFNVAFKPELMKYTQAYENSLHFSSCFQSYAESLAVHLIDRYNLHNKDIIEIGCGRGDFLKLLCKLGNNRGIGFDPCYTPEQNGAGICKEQITFIQDVYSERYAEYKADLILCRHVLEHIQSPRGLLNSVHRSVGNRLKTAVFFEVPNVSFTLKNLGIWDLIYEHYSYFNSNSLSYLFTSCGFKVCDLYETYEGQFLCIEASLSESSGDFKHTGDDLTELACAVATFADRYRRKVEAWRCKLERFAQAGRRVVVWGGGSKGVTFLNTLKTRDQIKYVVDVNPRKHGKYIAGTGQQIVPPDFLQDYQPDVVIVMNEIYKTEIQKIMERLNLTTNLICA